MPRPIDELTQQKATPAAEPLADFEASRRPIVLSYCTWVCDEARAEEAVDAAFARLERDLDAAEDDEPIKIDRLLREATRDVAAERVPATETRASLVRRIGGRDSTCDLMPTLLAARASGRLSDADEARLARHVDRCSNCRHLERRHTEAERAYEAFLVNGVPAESELTGVDDAPEPGVAVPPGDMTDTGATTAVVATRAPEPEIAPAAAQRASTTHFAGPAPDPPPAARRPGDGVSSGTRSPWLRRTAVGLLVAALIAALVILVASQSDEPDRADGERAASRQTAPASPAAPAQPPAAPAETAERPRDRTEARLDALGDRMLGPGATGPDVSALQRLIGVPRTGAYDPATQQAVLDLQTANGLNPDGNAGPETKRLVAERPPAASGR